MPIPRLTITQTQRLLHQGTLTSEQLAQYCLALAQAGDDVWGLHAFERLLDKDTVLEQARASDRRRAHNELQSPLEGLPFSAKANFAVDSLPLTAGSRMLATDAGVGYDAHVVGSLQDGGAVLLGSTTMDEFGMGSLGTHTAGDDDSSSRTHNPLWKLQAIGGRPTLSDAAVVEAVRCDPQQIMEAHHSGSSRSVHYASGGSSCGSAVSVAHGSSLFSLGSDTGGSVRLPAAWCGVVGLKPSYGLWSRDGLVSYASSLDTVGVVAPSVSCASAVWKQLVQPPRSNDADGGTMVDYGGGDPTCTRPVAYDLGSDNDEIETPCLRGIFVGAPSGFSVVEAPSCVTQAWTRALEKLAHQGATTQATDMITADVVQNALAAYYVLSSAEASSNLARYDGFRYGRCGSYDVASDWQNSTSTSTTLLERQYAAARTQGLGTEVVRRILCGTHALSSDRFHTHYEAAAVLRAALTQQMEQALAVHDVLVFPTALFSPPAFPDDDNQNTADDPTAAFANDVMTVPASLAGLPAIAVPMEIFWEGIPVPTSVQLVAGRWQEAKLLRVAAALQSSSSS